MGLTRVHVHVTTRRVSLLLPRLRLHRRCRFEPDGARAANLPGSRDARRSDSAAQAPQEPQDPQAPADEAPRQAAEAGAAPGSAAAASLRQVITDRGAHRRRHLQGASRRRAALSTRSRKRSSARTSSGSARSSGRRPEPGSAARPPATASCAGSCGQPRAAAPRRLQHRRRSGRSRSRGPSLTRTTRHRPGVQRGGVQRRRRPGDRRHAAVPDGDRRSSRSAGGLARAGSIRTGRFLEKVVSFPENINVEVNADLHRAGRCRRRGDGPGAGRRRHARQQRHGGDVVQHGEAAGDSR